MPRIFEENLTNSKPEKIQKSRSSSSLCLENLRAVFKQKNTV